MEPTYGPEDFVLLDLPEGLKELTPQLLFDLYDIAIKWGDRTEQCGNRSIHVFPWDDVVIQAQPEQNALMVYRGRKDSYKPLLVSTLFGLVLWDEKLSVQEVIDTIHSADETAQESGLLDVYTGERRPIPQDEIVRVRFAVDEMFWMPDIIYIYRDSGLTDEQILSEFDRPYLLGIVTYKRIKFVCLREFAEVLKARVRARSLLDRLAGDVPQLSWEDLSDAYPKPR